MSPSALPSLASSVSESSTGTPHTHPPWRNNPLSGDGDNSVEVLLYERIIASGVAVLLICIIIFLIFSCYKWKVLQRRHAERQKSRKRHQRDVDLDKQPMIELRTNPTPTPTPQEHSARPYTNPAYEEQDDHTYAVVDKRRSPARHSQPSSPPPVGERPGSSNLGGDGEDRFVSETRPERASFSQQNPDIVQMDRDDLIEFLAQTMRGDPDLESAVRDLAGPDDSYADVTDILNQLTTSALRDAYEEIQQQLKEQYPY